MDADMNVTLNIMGIRFKCVVCGQWWYLPKETLIQIEREGGKPIPYCGKCVPPDDGFKSMDDTVIESIKPEKDIENMTIEELQVS